MPAGYPLANTSPRWTRWWVVTKCDESTSFQIWLPCLLPKTKKEQDLLITRIRTRTMSFFLTKDNWPKFIVVKSASEERPLSKLSPFAVQKGFQAIAGTLKSTKKLRDGSFLVECSRRAQAENLLKTATFVDRPVHVCVHKTLNSSYRVRQHQRPWIIIHVMSPALIGCSNTFVWQINFV